MPMGTRILTGTDNGLYESSDSGGTWNLSSNYISRIRALATDGQNLFMGASGFAVYTSSLGAKDWRSLDSSYFGHTVWSLALTDSMIYAGTLGEGVIRSRKVGAGRKLSYCGPTAESTVNSLVVVGSTIVAGPHGDVVYFSTNGGDSWTPATRGVLFPDVRAFAIMGTRLFAGTLGGGVFVSTDTGKSWQAKNSGLMNLAVLDIIVSGSDLFVGTDDGVFKSSDSGDSWVSVSNGLTPVGSLDGSSGWMISLDQNYPNPFNPSTTISYSLPKTAIVSLTIFNALGQEIAVLVNEQRLPGYYQRQWHANVPSGIYFYRLQAGVNVETKKMILLR